MAHPHQPYWLGIAGALWAAGWALVGVAASAAAKPGFEFWSSTEMIVAYCAFAAGTACFGCAIRQVRFPYARGRQDVAPRRAQSEKMDELTASALFVRPSQIEGYAEAFVDRVQKLRELQRDLRGRCTVVEVWGPQGAGKTALAAQACLSLRRRREIRWFDCHEPHALTLKELAATLVVHGRSRAARQLAGSMAQSNGRGQLWLARTVMDYLDTRETILILDGYDNVRDEGVHELVRLAEQSRARATLLLISRRAQALHDYPRVSRHKVDGLAVEAALEFLHKWHVWVDEEVARRIWEASSGLPQAMLILAGWKRSNLTIEALRNIPARVGDLRSWLEPFFRELAVTDQEMAKLLAFLQAPADLDLLRAVDVCPGMTETAVDTLCGRFLLTKSGTKYRMHELVKNYIDSQITPAERAALGPKVARSFQKRARELLLGDHPSYGLLYLEAHPDYVADTEHHQRLVDDLMARLADLRMQPGPGSRILVLGSGNGIHDAALAGYHLQIIDLDIQPEIAKLGRDLARDVDGNITYVVADMTRPLPFPACSMDAVFNIGSSFGYEDEYKNNAAVFQYAARVLKPGAPFVFEYVNGHVWYARDHSTETLRGTGAVRTKYRIGDPATQTSLEIISLKRPGDDEPEWFHHFMHFYTIQTVEQMMTEGGLTVVRSYGAIDGRVTGLPFDAKTSTGMVIIARPADNLRG